MQSVADSGIIPGFRCSCLYVADPGLGTSLSPLPSFLHLIFFSSSDSSSSSSSATSSMSSVVPCSFSPWMKKPLWHSTAVFFRFLTGASLSMVYPSSLKVYFVHLVHHAQRAPSCSCHARRVDPRTREHGCSFFKKQFLPLFYGCCADRSHIQQS